MTPASTTSSTWSKFEKTTARLINPVTTATIGVRNPNNKSVAPANTSSLINQPVSTEACAIKMPATNARNSSSPNPGQPVGKAGNSFCRIVLL